jgi:hypothetical protein
MAWKERSRMDKRVLLIGEYIKGEAHTGVARAQTARVFAAGGEHGERRVRAVRAFASPHGKAADAAVHRPVWQRRHGQPNLVRRLQGRLQNKRLSALLPAYDHRCVQQNAPALHSAEVDEDSPGLASL